ncbi:hypothetical protein BDV35DRAFT_349445 [Aspergillus flavus]|uniref:Uncharacterized protein n=1 Tax=Aspergillus flavus TaxID=5059 RepID=A0A5N6H5W7_ASPFL|nr:hypothetical protein BDV35DRAFT_349445 [Aspergillus flavus]
MVSRTIQNCITDTYTADGSLTPISFSKLSRANHVYRSFLQVGLHLLTGTVLSDTFDRRVWYLASSSPNNLPV